MNIADMALETARTRLGQVVGALVLVGLAAPLIRRSRRTGARPVTRAGDTWR